MRNIIFKSYADLVKKFLLAFTIDLLSTYKIQGSALGCAKATKRAGQDPLRLHNLMGWKDRYR